LEPGGPNRSSSASPRSSISVSSAATNAAIRFVGPRAAAPAMTTKSQYGQIETQNGIWTYRATGGRAVDRVARLTDRATGTPVTR